MSSQAVLETIRRIEATSEATLETPSRVAGIAVIVFAVLVMGSSAVYTSYKQSQVIQHQEASLFDARERCRALEAKLQNALDKIARLEASK